MLADPDCTTTSTNRSELVRAAIETATFFDTGVFPAISRSKTPPKGFKRWPQRAARTPSEIRALFERYPGADAIALVIPAGWMVIDEEYVGALKSSGFHIPAGSLIAQSPGSKVPGHRGMHIFLRTRGNVSNIPDNRESPRYLELRGPGSYVIVPPDKGRHWIIGPGDVAAADVPYAPGWVEELTRTKRVARAERRNTGSVAPAAVMSSRGGGSKSCATELGAVLSTMFTDEQYLSMILPLCGIPDDRRPGDGRPFLCPYCSERRPSASLWRSDNQQIVIRCWHAGGGKHACPAPEWSLLPEAFAFQKQRDFVQLDGAALPAWSLRLLRDARVVTAGNLKLHLPPLSRTKRKIILAFAEVTALANALGIDSTAVAFTRNFASAYLDVPVRAVADTWAAALKACIIVTAGKSGIVRLWTLAAWIIRHRHNPGCDTSASSQDIRPEQSVKDISLGVRRQFNATPLGAGAQINGPP